MPAYLPLTHFGLRPSADGHLLKRMWAGGTNRLLLEPMEFWDKLATAPEFR